MAVLVFIVYQLLKPPGKHLLLSLAGNNVTEQGTTWDCEPNRL